MESEIGMHPLPSNLHRDWTPGTSIAKVNQPSISAPMSHVSSPNVANQGRLYSKGGINKYLRGGEDNGALIKMEEQSSRVFFRGPHVCKKKPFNNMIAL